MLNSELKECIKIMKNNNSKIINIIFYKLAPYNFLENIPTLNSNNDPSEVLQCYVRMCIFFFLIYLLHNIN